MALTQGAWTEKTVNGMYVTTCNVAFTSSETDAYTLPTPKGLDVTRAWTLIVAAAATADAQALPFDLWIGDTEDFLLTGDGSVTTVNGSNFKVITNDVVLAVTTVEHVFVMDPYLNVADVVAVANILTGYKLRIPIVPYYAFNLDGGSALANTNCDFTIVQSARKDQDSVNR